MHRAASIEGTGTKLAYVQGRWPEVIITTGLLELEKPSGAKLLIVACQELILWRVWSDSDSFILYISIYFYVFLNFLKFIQDIAHSAQVMEIYRCSNDQLAPCPSIPPGLESPRAPEVRWSISVEKLRKVQNWTMMGRGHLLHPIRLSRSFKIFQPPINVCLEIVDQACCCRALVWAGVAAV